MTHELASAREKSAMQRRLASALVILALGLLPGVPAVACPSGPAEAAHSHAHADDSQQPSSHHHPAGAALHDDVREPARAADAGSPPKDPSGHSGPSCCRGDSQAAMTAVSEGVRLRTLDAFPAPPVVTLLAMMPPAPIQVARDPRSLRPDERRSPYVRTRAPLLI